MRAQIKVLVAASALVAPTLDAAAEGLVVSAQPVEALVIETRQRAPGEVVPGHRTVLAAQIAARVASVNVDVGMSVKKGDVLVILDPRDFELALAQRNANITALDAQIEQARAQLERAESLIAKNFTSQEDVQARATSLAVLEGQRAVERAARDIARENLARTTITAPFDGNVVARDAQLGGFVSVASPLVTVSQSRGREVDVRAHPGAVRGLSAPGSTPIFSSYDRDYALRVARISPVIDATSQLQTVRFRFAGDEAPVGASGSVTWTSAADHLPSQLIERRDGQLGVFTVVDNTARFVAMPDASEGRSAPHGLEAGALVIVKGRTRLQDGDAVSVVRP